MGLRFRKSFKIVPGIKINLNKNSISTTIGTKGIHYTANSKGTRTTTVGIPGTGLSYSSTTNQGENNTMNTETNTTDNNFKKQKSDSDKKWYQKTGWIIFWLIVFFPVGLFLMWKYSSWNKIVKAIVSAFVALALVISPSSKLESVTLSADTSQIYDINQLITIKLTAEPSDYVITKDDFCVTGGNINITENEIQFSASKAGKYEVYVEVSEIKSNILTFVVEDKNANNEEIITPTPTEEPTPEATPEVTDEPTPEPTEEVTPDPTPTKKPIVVTTPEPTVEPTKEPSGNSHEYAVNGKNGKIHIVGQCSATGNGAHAMDNPVYFDTYEDAEAYSKSIEPSLKNRQCGNCW